MGNWIKAVLIAFTIIGLLIFIATQPILLAILAIAMGIIPIVFWIKAELDYRSK